ncbi:MAG: sugar phosphate nucleotidyltransferase [Thermoproteota archaeon]|jgi:UTP--glucose-1-phosphate uridylyltransferase
MIKSVITAAGKGTRLLPITKELPKEMMPIFARGYNKDRIVIPLLQFIFEQLYSIGLRDYCFVVGREKRSIEDHFTPHETYLQELSNKYKSLISDFYEKLENSHLIWVNQNKPRGFGDAVLRAERYVGKDNFIVHAGDVVIVSRTKHPIIRLIEIAKSDPSISAVLLCKKIKDAKRYGVPKVKLLSNGLYDVIEVEEKPTRPKSNLGLLPLYFFKPIIFECLREIKPGKGNEYQLTDAIQRLIEKNHKVVAISLNRNETELDVGTVESYKEALDLSYKIT